RHGRGRRLDGGTWNLAAPEDNLKTVKSTLDQFIEQYNGSLEEQEKYFQSLTAEDATYQTLESGIEQINGSHAGTNDLLIQLDDQLVQLQTSRTEATAALEESQK
ncbi:YkyA family protein, partial [Desemzia incerta]|uniref:YkyA family protein n=1 Tax=Desemzia incerta TaxID=82801 RepID=UPI003D040EAC